MNLQQNYSVSFEHNRETYFLPFAFEVIHFDFVMYHYHSNISLNFLPLQKHFNIHFDH